MTDFLDAPAAVKPINHCIAGTPFAGASDADLWRLRTPGVEKPPAIWQALRKYAPLAEFRDTFRELRSRTRGLPASTTPPSRQWAASPRPSSTSSGRAARCSTCTS